MEKKHQRKSWRPRLVLLGCGDIARRLLPILLPRFRVFAVLRRVEAMAQWRAAGAIPLLADLDQRASLKRIAGLGDYYIHLAPPQATGALDLRTRHLCSILPPAARLVYVSTSGVYGDCGGAFFDETRPLAPQNARAQRRVDAERSLRAVARARGLQLAILRAPGIYAADRLPLARLQQGTPALLPQDDVYTNHIHADDLAQLVWLALWRSRPNRVYHADDDSQLKMGEYFDLVADSFALPRAPRLPRAALAQAVTPAMLSFMRESRRLDNTRIKRELRVRLRYPQVGDGVRAAALTQSA